MTHENACFLFEIAVESFEAVGFLRDGELSITCSAALERAEMEGRVVDWEGHRAISDHSGGLPTVLREYDLVTKRMYPDRRDEIFVFIWDGNKWCEDCLFLGTQVDRNFLVLRHRS